MTAPRPPAGTLLERELPPGYQEERSRHFAQVRSGDADERAAALSLAIFRLGPEWLALPSAVLAEVAAPGPVHGLPHRRGGLIAGVVNIRGTLLVCVSLAGLLGLDAAARARQPARSDQGRLLVLRGGRGRLACAVDEMAGLRRVDSRDLRAPPATLDRATLGYTRAALPWRERVVGCLDAERVLRALERSLA